MNEHKFEAGDSISLTEEGFAEGDRWKWGGQNPLHFGVIYVVVGSHSSLVQLQDNKDSRGQYCVYNPSAFKISPIKNESMRDYRKEVAELCTIIDQKCVELELSQIVTREQKAEIERLQAIVSAREKRIRDLWEDYEKISAGVSKSAKDIAKILESKRYRDYMKAK